MRPFDPVTLANEAMVGLLQSDTFIASLNWQRWENNNPTAALPRGYVNTTVRSALDDAESEEQVAYEVVIEAAPKADISREILATVVGHCVRSDLATVLTARITDGSLTYIGKPQGLSMSQVISGQIREFKIAFVMYASWNVKWIPD